MIREIVTLIVIISNVLARTIHTDGTGILYLVNSIPNNRLKTANFHTLQPPNANWTHNTLLVRERSAL